MKIEHKIKVSQVHLHEIEDGKCFRWTGNYYMKTDKTTMSHWIGGEYKYNVYVVKLEDGNLGELPSKTLVTRESAKVVIE